MNFTLPLMPEAQHTKTTQHLQWPSHTNRRQKSNVTVRASVVLKQPYSSDQQLKFLEKHNKEHISFHASHCNHKFQFSPKTGTQLQDHKIFYQQKCISK
jgi:hypothetical protein